MRVNATKVLVKDFAEVEKETKSGIILPDAVVKKTVMKGKVIIVGEGTDDIKIAYDIGDTVLFQPHAGTKFTYENEELRLLDVAEVLLGGV